MSPDSTMRNAESWQMLVLPYPPSANRYVRTANGRHYTPSSVLAYRQVAAWRAKSLGVRLVLGNLEVEVVLHPKRPQRWKPGQPVRRIDLGNCEKVASDALNGIAWLDDSQLVRIALEVGEPIPGGALVVFWRPANSVSRPFHGPVGDFFGEGGQVKGVGGKKTPQSPILKTDLKGGQT